MTRLTCILAATDLSAPSRLAADRAARLAHETGATLHLLHVLPGAALQELRQWLGAGHVAESRLQEDARRELHELAAQLQTMRHATVNPVATIGAVLDEIDQQAFSPWSGPSLRTARRVAPHAHLVLLSAFQILFEDKVALCRG